MTQCVLSDDKKSPCEGEESLLNYVPLVRYRAGFSVGLNYDDILDMEDNSRKTYSTHIIKNRRIL